MLYIASALPPTAVIDSRLIKGFAPTCPSSLLIAKPDRVELHNVTPAGLELLGSLDVWGNIVAIESVQLKGARPHLLVLLAPPSARLLLLTYSPTAPYLAVTSSIALTPPTPSLRQAEFFASVIVRERTALVSLWIGVLAHVEMALEGDKASKRRRSSVVDAGEPADRRVVLKEASTINIREHNLLHLAFLPVDAATVVSFLYLSPTDELRMQLRILSSRSFTDASPSINVLQDDNDEGKPFAAMPYSCPAARRVLPIPPLDGCQTLLVIGDEFSVLYSLSNDITSPKARRTSIASPRASNTRRSPQTELHGPAKRHRASLAAQDYWSPRPVFRARQGFGTVLSATVLHAQGNSASVLLGDECGRLTALSFSLDEERVELEKVDFGMTSPPSALVPLGGSYVFAGSAAGDSQVFRLGDVALQKGKNVAPIEPMVEPVDGDGTVEALQRWTNLAPVKDFAIVEDESGGLSHLVIASGSATANSLRIVRSGVGLEEVLRIDGLEGIERMWRLPGRIVASTATDSIAIETEPEVRVDEFKGEPLLAVSEHATVSAHAVTLAGKAAWTAQKEIVAAQIENQSVVLAQRGGVVSVLALGTEITTVFDIQAPAEVSSVDINSKLLVLGTWTNEILVYSIDALKAGNSQPLVIKEEGFAVSLLLTQGRSTARLLAGLSDGSLLTIDLALEPLSLIGRKISKLGSRPLRLERIVDWQGDEQVVAIALSERMSVIFQTKDRIDFSSVSRRDVQAATCMQINGEQALLLATPSGLSVSRVNSLKKLSVQTLDMQERSATKLAYLANTLATGSVVRSVDSQTGEIIQRGIVELRDATSLQLKAELQLLAREIVTALSAVSLAGRTLLAVGTASFDRREDFEDWVLDGAVDAPKGRVLLIDTSRGEIDIVATKKTVGPVHDVAGVSGLLAIAAASKVSINRLDGNTLSETGSFSSTFIAQHLQIVPPTPENSDERLLIGDGLRSITTLDVHPASGKVYGDQRDMATHSVHALGSVRDVGEGAIISDAHANLLTFRLRDTIETAASFGLHEPVVRFRRASLAPPASAADVIAPDLIFMTPDGRLGVVGELTPSAALTLGELQRNMDKYVQGPAGQEWRAWRRGGSEVVKRETAGFVDGDFVQTLLRPEVVGKELVDKAIRGTHSHERVHRLDSKGRKGEAGRAEVGRVLESVAGVY